MLRGLDIGLDFVAATLFQLRFIEVNGISFATWIIRLIVPIKLTSVLIRSNALLLHLTLGALLYSQTAMRLHIILQLGIILILPQIIPRVELIFLCILDILLDLLELRILVGKIFAPHPGRRLTLILLINPRRLRYHRRLATRKRRRLRPVLEIILAAFGLLGLFLNQLAEVVLESNAHSLVNLTTDTHRRGALNNLTLRKN